MRSMQTLLQNSERSTFVIRNRLKRRSGSFVKFPASPETPADVVESLYVPTKLEEFVACFDDSRMGLLDGSKIIPILARTSDPSRRSLQYGSLAFTNILGISDWVQSFRKKASSISVYGPIAEPAFCVLADTISQEAISELKPLVAYLNSAEALSTKKFNDIFNTILHANPTKFFTENIYSYLLREHVLTMQHLKLIISSIQEQLYSKLDHPDPVEKLIADICCTAEKIHVIEDMEFTEHFSRLLAEVQQVFSSKQARYTPELLQLLFGFYIKAGNLSESRRVLSQIFMVNKRPNDSLLHEYITLVDMDTLEKKESGQKYLHEIAYLSGFIPILKSTTSIPILKYFIQNCRHYTQLDQLFDLILEKEDLEEILKGILPTVLETKDKLCGKGATGAIYSFSSTFYSKVNIALKGKLSHPILIIFLKQFTKESNKMMLAKVINSYEERNGEPMPFTLVTEILLGAQALHFKLAEPKWQPFVSQYILAYYRSLSNNRRRLLIPYIGNVKQFENILKEEAKLDSSSLAVFKNLILHGSRMKLLDKVSKSTWQYILGISHIQNIYMTDTKVHILLQDYFEQTD